jgi:hypothetical protein
VQGRGCQGVAWVMAVLVLVVGCTSSTNAVAGVAAYAEGRWACTLAEPIGPPMTAITADVSVDDDSAGRVRIGLAAPGGGRRRLLGSWRLDGGRLTVRWDAASTPADSSVGPTYGRSIALDARHIQVRGERRDIPGSGNWVPIAVDRRARSVTFRIAHQDIGVFGQLTCRKA